MPINAADFNGILRPSKFHKELSKTLLPFRDGERPTSGQRSEFLESLLSDIQTGRYAPSIPRGYIVLDKGNYVPRIVPVLAYRDMCVYIYCIVQLQDRLAVNRVDGTFGGWQLGNPMREREEEEQRNRAQAALAEVPYGPAFALNPFRWVMHWRDFQREAFERSRSDHFRAFIEFDIANFYDSINLEVLQRRIRGTCEAGDSSTIDLLFTLLRQWNRQYQGYIDKTVGLPQEEGADCSRILANFYLQEYDASMSFICRDQHRNAEYLRYADDQIILAESLTSARQILVDAGRNLHEVGLNLNASKVKEFRTREDFDYYWTFDLMEMFGDESDDTLVNEAAARFNQLRREDEEHPGRRPWRWWSVEKRIVRIGLERLSDPHRSEIVDHLLREESVERMEASMLARVARGLTKAERQRFFAVIDDCVPRVPFNSFHLNLRRFFARYGEPWRPIEEIDQRIQELNDLWAP